ncbi:hypothetical protein RUM44_009062 [Polyplax serrata]|uniref:Programmed cell death protein 2 C-terminal domain-containing protein n=1 Tax=Polyplax serrata TaxID=468196 RepID=A0ABR1AT51_POLSC
MAKSKKNTVVLLGYEDETVTEKHKPIVGYWTNKVGGCPDWPVGGISSPICQLCGLTQVLVVQIYAPIENSAFHRTLYVFCCINPNCWNHSESWTCLRSQYLDPEESTSRSNVNGGGEWCAGADDWNDGNGNFENGNTVSSLHSMSDNESDESDSCSLSAMIGNMTVDECNANWDGMEKSSGAVGKQMSPVATAEIEKEESEVVCIDTPTTPQKDLLALLQETAPVPHYMRAGERNQNALISFSSFFISVAEEGTTSCNSDHIRELILEYQRNNGDVLFHGSHQHRDENEAAAEDYEKAIPAHGDKMFHHFLNRIQKNPGQILRYNREGDSPLLFYPLRDVPRKCSHCNGEATFEMQLLPTLIPKLQFPDEEETRVEFGTVLIYTCKKSCWSSDDKIKFERVIVQVEKING